MSEPQAGPVRVRDLSVEPHGSAVLILHSSGGDEAERRIFRAVPVLPGDGLVLASAAAIRSGGFKSALRHACRLALTAAGRSRPSTADGPRLWLAVSGTGRADGRGRSLAQKLSREFTAPVFAPDGPITFVAGGSIFAGADHHGWLRFAAGGPGELHGARYPRPEWETRLPRGTVHDGGLHTAPVPAGVVTAASADPVVDQVAHAVAVSPWHPRVVLGAPGAGPIAPHQVAALLRRFPRPLRERMQLVPGDPRTAAPHFLARVAELVEQDLVATTGLVRHDTRAEFVFVPDELGDPLWRPFPAMLRYRVDGLVEPVLAGAPPRGWVPGGPLWFRWGGSPEPRPTPHELIAKVIPAGLALVPAGEAGTPDEADRLAFEPERLTIALGRPCAPLPEGAPQALHRLLAGLDPEQAARVRVLVLGITGAALRAELRAAAGAAADRLQFPAVITAPEEAIAASVPMLGEEPAVGSGSDGAVLAAGGDSGPDAASPELHEQRRAATAAGSAAAPGPAMTEAGATGELDADVSTEPPGEPVPAGEPGVDDTSGRGTELAEPGAHGASGTSASPSSSDEDGRATGSPAADATSEVRSSTAGDRVADTDAGMSTAAPDGAWTGDTGDAAALGSTPGTGTASGSSSGGAGAAGADVSDSGADAGDGSGAASDAGDASRPAASDGPEDGAAVRDAAGSDSVSEVDDSGAASSHDGTADRRTDTPAAPGRIPADPVPDGGEGAAKAPGVDSADSAGNGAERADATADPGSGTSADPAGPTDSGSSEAGTPPDDVHGAATVRTTPVGERTEPSASLPGVNDTGSGGTAGGGSGGVPGDGTDGDGDGRSGRAGAASGASAGTATIRIPVGGSGTPGAAGPGGATSTAPAGERATAVAVGAPAGIPRGGTAAAAAWTLVNAAAHRAVPAPQVDAAAPAATEWRTVPALQVTRTSTAAGQAGTRPAAVDVEATSAEPAPGQAPAVRADGPSGAESPRPSGDTGGSTASPDEHRGPAGTVSPATAGSPAAEPSSSAPAVDAEPASSPVPSTAEGSGKPALPKRRPGASPLSRQSAERRARARERRKTASEKENGPRAQKPAPDIPTMRMPLAAAVAATGAPEPAVALAPAVVRPPFDPDRPASPQECADFAAQVGAAFDEALPAVNSALAAFPALREKQVQEAKPDFVAVHLYLGAGRFGGNRVNAALRGGGREEFADYAACLLSGLRRLPVHRGPVFRLLDREALMAYEPGMVLVEPGFVSASPTPEVTADGFAEVLLWSHSARRTAAFHRHGLPDEVVFPAGARFLVLAADADEAQRPALLLRELRADEEPGREGPSESDRALLERMRRCLEQRHRATPRHVTGDALDRITAPIGLIPS